MIHHSALWKNRKNSFPRLARDLSVDVLIIGGGMTGVSAAFWLSRSKPGFKVALIEKGLVGSSTGKGTGILRPEMDIDYSDMLDKFGLGFARKFYSDYWQVLKEIRQIIRRHKIDCDFNENGTLTGIFRKHDTPKLENEYRARQKIGEKSMLLDTKGLKKILNSSLRAAIWSPNDAVFNQEKFIFHLAHKSSGVKIYEHTPAFKISKKKKGYLVATPHASIQAKKIILAAGSGDLGLIRYRRKIIKLTCFVLASKPFNRQQLKRINWRKAHAIWPMGKIYDFIRMSADKRLIVGGEDAAIDLGPKRRQAHFDRLKKFVSRVFPDLGRVAFDYEWSGEIFFAKNELPQIGRIGNLRYAFAYAGTGLLVGFAAGKRLAKEILKSKT